MKVLTPVLVLLACIVSTGATAGQFKVGNKLLEECPGKLLEYCCVPRIYPGHGRCGKAACIPLGVPASQVKDVVVQYLMKNPSERHYSGGHLAIARSERHGAPSLRR